MTTLALVVVAVVFFASLAIRRWVRATESRFGQVPSAKGLTGAEVARAILDAHGLTRVKVEAIPAALPDHYDPMAKAVRLSEPNYHSSSLTALAVAAHEAAHAVQDVGGCARLGVRHNLSPVVKIISNLVLILVSNRGPILVLIGLLMGALGFARLGLGLFLGLAIFNLGSLPMEFDASWKALGFLQRMGFLTPEEMPAARQVLTTATLTYVVALANNLAVAFYHASLLGFFGGW